MENDGGSGGGKATRLADVRGSEKTRVEVFEDRGKTLTKGVLVGTTQRLVFDAQTPPTASACPIRERDAKVVPKRTATPGNTWKWELVKKKTWGRNSE